jgi:hypothetical protein
LRYCKDDGNDRCRPLYCGDGGPKRDNDVNLEADKLGCDLGVALGAPFRPAIFDRDGATLDPAEFTQPPFGPTERAMVPGRLFIAGLVVIGCEAITLEDI